MHVNQWIEQAIQALSAAEVDSARLDAQLIAAHVLSIDRAHVIASKKSLTATQRTKLDELLRRRVNREPLAYLTGEREFYGLTFSVNEHVLIPRPETEVMVSYIIANPRPSMLELGTGCGAIALSVAHTACDMAITATDISPQALQVATDNQLRLGADVSMIESDLFESVSGTYDIIAANLPYVPTTARRQPEILYEPDIALYGDEDGLHFYRLFFAQVARFMKPHGYVIIEASPTQFRALESLAAAQSMHLEALSEYIFVATYQDPSGSL